MYFKFIITLLLCDGISAKLYIPFPLWDLPVRDCEIRGRPGHCIYAFECRRISGHLLGLCRDGFLFGACCQTRDEISVEFDRMSIDFNDGEPDVEENCGRAAVPHVASQSRIVNGSEAERREFPWQISLHAATPFGVTIGICGAVVINELWSVTAAHCILPLRTEDLVLRFGVHSVYTYLDTEESIERKVKRKIVHPEFQSIKSGHDIGLLSADSPVQFNDHIRPICLPEPTIGDLVGRIATITGFGLTLKEDDKSPVYLHKAQVPILRNSDCSKMYSITFKRKFKVADNILCAGYQDGRIDTCHGDSGGPLQILSEKNRWILAGITSTGAACARSDSPGLYARVSTYVTWIKNYTSQNFL